MALLNTYKSPQANILYGSGSKKYSAKQIKDYITAPGRTDDEVLGRALADGVSVDEISAAMKGNANYSTPKIESYLAGKGITRDLAEPARMPTATAPPPVVPERISVGHKETVAGQMHDILEDPNNPLNVQATTYGKQYANKRGLLNSSIAASATQDALYKNAQPIAAADAATNYDSKKTNAGNSLTAGMFNNDLTSRVGMFNAGTEKDIGINTQNRNADVAINTQNRNMDLAIANMDADIKMEIAQVQAAANDSGIVGDLGKSFMSLYQQTASDPNMSDALKLETFNTLKSQFESISSLLPSFENKARNLSFLSASPAGGTSSGATPASGNGLLNGGTAGSEGGLGTVPKTKEAISKINTLGYQPEPHTLAAVAAFERSTGSKVDKSLVVPEQLVQDFLWSSPGGYTTSYLSRDGTNKVRNSQAYDFRKLFDLVGTKDKMGGLQSLFIPVDPPDKMGLPSGDPLFYVWNTEMLDKIK